MGHQTHVSFAFLRSRLRLLSHTLYPSFVFRHAVCRPLSLLSIAFVVALITIGAYLVVPFTLLPLLATEPWVTAFWLLTFCWCIACTFLSYFLTATAVPGRVPTSWRPQAWQHELSSTKRVSTTIPSDDAVVTTIHPVPPPDVISAGTSMLRPDGRYRFCVHCKVFKPDRTHHCSTCQECVLQMDHHCPFTGNSCVGLLNRKFFILFLYYATLSCTLVAALAPRALLKHILTFDSSVTPMSIGWSVVLLMGYILCLLHAIALALFSAFHTYLVLKNRTTIENHEPRQPSHVEVLRRMDRGRLDNWNATFGPHPWLWFVPISYGRPADPMQWHVTKQPHALPSLRAADDHV